ncbi:PH domain protein [Dictyocaulus viviparus]|uniref:PH domain protein n=1 Tax=Dictyocaulus viviparus TaxID=29172 RepID=A0A0D8XZT9_DICVI|nr:PH domain protein [Dictyocaulus viviparus]
MRSHRLVKQPTNSPMFTDHSLISFQQYVESWSGKQIARWIEGVGDAMNPYVAVIRDNIKSGKQLYVVDDEMLANIGITALGPRKTILQAIQLLLYFCTEAPSENLQSLAMRVVVACKAAIYELGKTLRCRDEKNLALQPLTRVYVVSVINSIFNSVSVLVESVKKLVLWLDRSPFDDIKQYVEIRNRIAFTIWDVVSRVNVQPKTLFTFASEVIQRISDLQGQCEDIVRNNDDPVMLCAAYVERALLRRHDVNKNWGINLQSSFRGVHVISEIKAGSPADLCGRLDAGDEIILINGKTPSRPLAKVIPGSQAADTAERGKKVFKEITYPLNRRRSSTFITELLNVVKTKGANLRATRRSSLCDESPRKTFSVPGSDIHEVPITIPQVVRRARTMRHQPDGPTEFAEVSVVEPNELCQLNIAAPSCSDSEWSAPYKEGTTQRYRANESDSSLSGILLDSPRCINATGCDDFWVLPRPASVTPTSSVSSPTQHLISNEWNNEYLTLSPNSLDMKTVEKTFEGWVRRRKTAKELFVNEVTKKWPRCWMRLRGSHLSIYPNQFTSRADMIINIAGCVVSSETELKTSKKFVFRLSKPPTELHFSCYTQNDMRTWIHKIALATISHLEGEGENSASGRCNTLTGLPYLVNRSKNNHCGEPCTVPVVSSTLPRSTSELDAKCNRNNARFITEK